MPRQVDKMPVTSLDAFKALTPEKLANDYKCILMALKVLKCANYEQIAHLLTWVDINKCSRRLRELEGLQLIYKDGSKSLTKRNRQAFNYKLVTNGEVSAQPEKQLEGKSVGEFAQSIIHFDDESFLTQKHLDVTCPPQKAEIKYE